MWQGVNKRRFPRVEYPCKIVVAQKDKKASFKTDTENIGVGGVCVSLEKGLNKFSEVDLEVLINDKPIKCKGKVVWVIKKTSARPVRPELFDTGIEFVDLSEEDRLKIEKVVEEQLNADTD